ncbi:GRIP and coiled-coil domain-containing protein 2 [Halotydeus destructor]|nr:GRIP and coiled-coil domain-containing protein 2 [Halotydeus destructor]
MLALKLKKELAEAKSELQAKLTESSKTESNKQLVKENDRLSNLYQQMVKNFQSLQSEYDNLQDERDTLASGKKSSDNDLNQTIIELSRVREDVAEIRDENNVLRKRINGLERELDDSLNRRKELESKIILLENDLVIERRKLVNQTGLEKTVNELRVQIDLKTTELVEFGDQIEKSKTVGLQRAALAEELQVVRLQLETLTQEYNSLHQQNSDLKNQFENMSSNNEEDRLKIIDLVNENGNLQSMLQSARESSSRRVKDYEKQLLDLKETISIIEVDSESKQADFEMYKLRVHRILNEKSADTKQVELERQLKSEVEQRLERLETQLALTEKHLETAHERSESLLSELNQSKLSLTNLTRDAESNMESVKKENESLKSLSRDLQCKIVHVRNDLEKKVRQLEESITKKEAENRQLQQQLTEAERSSTVQDHSSLLHLISDEISSGSETVQAQSSHVQISPRSDAATELDSLGSASLPSRTKRFSISSASGLGMLHLNGQSNVLDEILNRSNFDFDNISIAPEENSRITRLTELLEESESSNLLLSEQNRFLKDDIKRLELSISRVEVAQNLEYLKNLLVKFVSLEPGTSEKLQLVPVIKTILKLSKEEETLLTSSAYGMEGDSGTSQPNQHSTDKGWSSYIWG